MVIMLCLQICVSRQPHSCLIGWLVAVAALAVAAVLWVQHAARLLGVRTPSACRRQAKQTEPDNQLKASSTSTYRLSARRYDGRRFTGWHVRDAPSSRAKSVAQLQHGDEVEVVEVRIGSERAQGDWLLLADGRGWLRKEHDGAAWSQVDEHGALVADRWSGVPPTNLARTVRKRIPTRSRSTVAAAVATPVAAAVTAGVFEQEKTGASALSLNETSSERDTAAAAPPRPLPSFTYCSEMQNLATEAAGYATSFLADDSWEAAPSSVPSAVTWRMRSSPVLGSPIRPFKARGVVKDVEPVVLATMFLGLALKWPERNRKIKKKKQEVRRVEQVDWSTTLWFEHEKIPFPLVADREVLYLETFKHCTNGSAGESFMIVRKSVEKDDVPVAPGRVRGLSYVVMTFRRDPAGCGTEQTLAMDFDIKGRIPGRALDGFLAQQAGLFDKLSKFVGSKDGQDMIERVKKKIPEDRLHPSHPMHGVMFERD